METGGVAKAAVSGVGGSSCANGFGSVLSIDGGGVSASAWWGIASRCVGSMIGALAAARRRTSENVLEGMQKRKQDDAHQPPPMPARREETIIVPPEA